MELNPTEFVANITTLPPSLEPSLLNTITSHGITQSW
jgi:hypothetical protein